MAKILLTGIITLDIINLVDQYPAEDMEIRALDQHIRCGGNASNTASILRQYQHQCYLASTLADDASASIITSHLQQQGIEYNPVFVRNNSATPTSYICLSQLNGSRTIVHHRDLAELQADQFALLDLSGFDWFHFEGRNIQQVQMMVQRVKSYHKPVSLEAEKDRPDIDILFPLSDIIFFSRPFAESRGFTDAESCLRHFAMLYKDKLLTCTWGNQGAWAINQNQLFHSPAVIPDKVIDTIGAGDTYNAAMIHALCTGLTVQQSLQQACDLAGRKCAQQGFTTLVQ